MRIAIANDVPMAAEALRRVVARTPEHELAWIARNGAEAVENCARDTPDLVLMDLTMPVMDGEEATRRIMADSPCAILIVTTSENTRVAKIFATLGAGALDVVNTPILGPDLVAGGASSLLSKIRIMERLVGSESRSPVPPTVNLCSSCSQQLIVIGASAGGPAALAAILADLPSDFSAAIVIVQHIDASYATSMADWLDAQSALLVRPARDGDIPQAGTVLVAGSEKHLVFVNSRTLGYTSEPENSSYHPSIDVFFESAARRRNGKTVGVLLTGMGQDGAKGLKALRDAGAVTIAQDRGSCVVYGMPKAAAKLHAALEILPLKKIAPRLLGLCSQCLTNEAVPKP